MVAKNVTIQHPLESAEKAASRAGHHCLSGTCVTHSVAVSALVENLLYC
jgi:hypothetical protein